MNNRFVLKAIISISLIIYGLTSYAQFEIQGVFRPRFEYRDGYRRLRTEDTKPASFVSQRTRLIFKYHNDILSTRITLYDFRVWGDQVWKRDVASLGVHEVWFELNLSNSTRLKLGRQELNYDNRRIISPVNWNQIGATHDAGLFRFRKDEWELDLCAAWNQSSQNVSGTHYESAQYFYKNLNIVWLSKEFNNIIISTLNIIDGYEDTSNVEVINYRFTNGLIIKYDKHKFQFATRGFYQWGKLQFGNNVIAYYLSGNINYKLYKHLKVMTGFELMSGNNGLDSLNRTSHAFFLQNNFVYKGEVINKFLGHEIDLTVSKSIKKYLHISGGYSMMFATPSMEIIKGGTRHRLNHWAFIMINVNPIFFKTNV